MSLPSPEIATRPDSSLERLVQLLDRQASGAKQVDRDPRVNRTRARAHHQALERREAHGRPRRPPIADRRHRAAAAEVGDDEVPFARLPDRPIDRQPVEAEATDAPLVGPLAWDGVAPRRLGQSRVEGRVETGNVRRLGQG